MSDGDEGCLLDVGILKGRKSGTQTGPHEHADQKKGEYSAAIWKVAPPTFTGVGRPTSALSAEEEAKDAMIDTMERVLVGTVLS